MKNITLLLICAILYPIYSTAQTIQNGHFDINNGNDDPAYTGACGGTFLNNGGLQNWYKTHGTPRFLPGCNEVLDANIFMTFNPSSNNSGEGIAAHYPFKKGVKYIIKIGLCDYSNFNTFSEKIVVKATSTLPSNLPTPPSCLSQIPILGAGFEEAIVNISNTSNPSIGNDMTFTFTPLQSRDYIWIYPESPASSGAVAITLKYVIVVPECEQDIYIVGTLPGLVTESYSHYRHMYIGSSYGPTPNMVQTHPDVTITYVAKESITFKPDFWSLINHADHFIACIDPNTCEDGDGTDSDDSGDADSGMQKPNAGNSQPNYHVNLEQLIQEENDNSNIHPIVTRVNQINNTSSSISIYPNPSKGSFTINIPTKGKYTVEVVNMVGTIVQKATIENEYKKTITLKSNLPSGNYMINITGENISHREKVVLMK